ncbi:MAG: TIGR04283 family arsenosugar biosynthesis glycosyltransferase [Nitrospira sp.]|nr:TIGR04283 family arsenosugar biosynthesis glycosyltransferase [Nitrospira sp.]
MTISVIIPTLNEQTTLTRTVMHAGALDFDELILVDGGSTDGTLRLAESLCARAANTRIVSAARGRAGQMNAGAGISHGDILLFLHADTLLPAEAGRIIRDTMADSTIVGGRFDVRFDSPSRWGRMISSLMNRRSRLTGISTGDQAIFVRRATFEQLGGFADIPLMEDIELSRRLKRAGRIAALQETVITSFRRWETQGPLKTILLMWTLRFMYWLGVSPLRLSLWYKTVR